jgi:hypothetical protein
MTRTPKLASIPEPAMVGDGACGFEPLRVAVARIALTQNITREVAATQVAARALSGAIDATGFSLASPPIEDIESEIDIDANTTDDVQPFEPVRQPIPAGAWADFVAGDYGADAIRERAPNGQLRCLFAWTSVHVSIAPAIIEPAKPRAAPAMASAIAEAKKHVIALRMAGEAKPGGDKAGLISYLGERFGLTKHQAEDVAREARDAAPCAEWDQAGRRKKPSQNRPE